jgi:hypothetical protein
MVNASADDICSRAKNLIFAHFSVKGIFNNDITSSTLKKHSAAATPLEVMKQGKQF